jgi:cyclopropane-fatty-acyl-phospholipid synthase
MSNPAARAIGWAEQGLIPDTAIRAGIRRLLASRLTEIHGRDAEASAAATADFIAHMNASAVAVLPGKANEQHYEVPAGFFGEVLGAHRKYSSCYWVTQASTLDGAEDVALRVTARRAELTDGMRILELGCGWGSLSLWMARQFPCAHITAVSNSHSQRDYIQMEAQRRGLTNLEVITSDMNRFDTGARFDRVVSVEMFEHMRNWREMFRRVRGWLNPGGRFFMHVFVHRSSPYLFVERDASDWMSRHFFAGGMMPSDDLALHFQDDLRLLRRWRWDGTHYERTANAWLANMDARRGAVLPVLESTYGRAHAAQWWMRWRIFFMSCAELFGYDRGQQWWVSHYLFEPRA